MCSKFVNLELDATGSNKNIMLPPFSRYFSNFPFRLWTISTFGEAQNNIFASSGTSATWFKSSLLTSKLLISKSALNNLYSLFKSLCLCPSRKYTVGVISLVTYSMALVTSCSPEKDKPVKVSVKRLLAENFLNFSPLFTIMSYLFMSIVSVNFNSATISGFVSGSII